MLWNPGDNGDTIWGELAGGAVSTARVWTTVDNRGMKIVPLTRRDAMSSPIHRPYYNNTKISSFFVGRQA
jgi:hypothetical protein